MDFEYPREGEMSNSNINQAFKGRNVTIQTDTVLDCRAQKTFYQACMQADHPEVQEIVVDLAATQGIRASGVGLLLTLSDLRRWSSVQVRLINCDPHLKAQLASSRLLADLCVT